MTTAARRNVPATPVGHKPSKEELRAQVEKLERTVATLRARSREAVCAAKQAAARIEELEAQLAARTERTPEPAAAAPRAVKRGPKRTAAAAPNAPKVARSVRARRLSAERDPGDGVPPGVAVQEPEPMDEEATAAFESLEAKLHPAGA